MRRMITSIVVLILLGIFTGTAQAEPNCEEWNTKEFFEAATVEDVTACLDAGADPAATDDAGITPLH